MGDGDRAAEEVNFDERSILVPEAEPHVGAWRPRDNLGQVFQGGPVDIVAVNQHDEVSAPHAPAAVRSAAWNNPSHEDTRRAEGDVFIEDEPHLQERTCVSRVLCPTE